LSESLPTHPPVYLAVLEGYKAVHPYVDTDSMKIRADPRVINKLSRIERCFLSDLSAPAATYLPLPPLPPADVSSILQVMATSNSENSQAARKLHAQLVEGHTKLSTEGSSRAKFWTRLPEFIRKLILAACVSALDSLQDPNGTERGRQGFPRVSKAVQSIHPRECSLGRLEKPPSPR